MSAVEKVKSIVAQSLEKAGVLNLLRTRTQTLQNAKTQIPTRAKKEKGKKKNLAESGFDPLSSGL
jgi:hypothetical protein